MSDAKWAEIRSLDLGQAKKKLLAKKGWWWRQRNDIDKIEKEYKQFLYLIATNPGKTVVPWSQQLDDLWHEHILDTPKYTADCKKLFGKYVHHNPHLDRGTAAQRTAYRDTQKMYTTAFGKKAAEVKRNGGTTDTESPGCGAFMPIVFSDALASCGSGPSAASCGTNTTPASCGSGGGGSSCGGSGCGGGSSCGGGGCGGS
jgi:uncharacterized membrane protein YgcG